MLCSRNTIAPSRTMLTQPPASYDHLDHQAYMRGLQSDGADDDGADDDWQQYSEDQWAATSYSNCSTGDSDEPATIDEARATVTYRTLHGQHGIPDDFGTILPMPAVPHEVSVVLPMLDCGDALSSASARSRSRSPPSGGLQVHPPSPQEEPQEPGFDSLPS